MFELLNRAILSLFKTMLELQDVSKMVVEFFSAGNINQFFGSSGAINQLGNIPTMIKSIAYALLGVGFILGLYSMAVRSDTIQAQGVLVPLKFFFKVMIIKILTETIQPLFLTVVRGFASFARQAFTLTGNSNISQNQALISAISNPDGSIKDDIVSNARSLYGFVSMILILVFLFGVIYMMVVHILIGFYLLGVMLDCLLYYFASPIAVASLATEEWSATGKNYLKTILSIGVNLLLIAIAVRLGVWVYSFLFSQNMVTGSTLGKVLFNNLVASPADFVKVLQSSDPKETLLSLGHGDPFVFALKVILNNIILGTIILTFIKKAKSVANTATGGALQ